jgi:hypothetical protein
VFCYLKMEFCYLKREFCYLKQGVLLFEKGVLLNIPDSNIKYQTPNADNFTCYSKWIIQLHLISNVTLAQHKILPIMAGLQTLNLRKHFTREHLILSYYRVITTSMLILYKINLKNVNKVFFTIKTIDFLSFFLIIFPIFAAFGKYPFS